jgi:hypothetical protein
MWVVQYFSKVTPVWVTKINAVYDTEEQAQTALSLSVFHAPDWQYRIKKKEV